jgi:hypothetical protein
MKLVFTAGPRAGHRVEFDGTITLGRAPANALCLDEARLMAGFSHPNVVSIHHGGVGGCLADVWKGKHHGHVEGAD